MSDISYSKFLIKSKFNPKKAKKYMESYDKIMESGLFDKNYYLKAYPHIAKSGMDPMVHYLFYGYKEDKNPSAQFNLKRYLDYDIMEVKSIYDISNIKKDFNYEDVVTYVNANLDKEYYSSDNLISNEDASKIDVLVNNASIAIDTDFEDKTVDNFRKILDINL